MCDNSNTSTIGVNNQLIPHFVGQYRRKRDEKIPQIILTDSESILSESEKSLINFFKCTQNWDKCVNSYSKPETTVQCLATRNTSINFINHLEQRHRHKDINNKVVEELLVCVYCHHKTDKDLLSTLKTYSHRYLIKHMFKRHRFRRYQCSLCRERAITEEHIVIHQKTKHKSEYLKATSGDCTTDDTVCRIYLCQLPVENCNKRFPTLEYFYRKYKSRRMNCEEKYRTCYQCLYCSQLSNLLPEVVHHCAHTHRDYPILYYKPESQVSSTVSELVYDFMDNIAIVRPNIRPKLEPQDSSSKMIVDINDCLAKKRPNVEKDNVLNKGSKADEMKTLLSTTVVNVVDSQIICLFCDRISSDCETAKQHIETHFGTLNESNSSMKTLVMNWIQNFILKQFWLCSFDDIPCRKEMRKAFYSCPLCVKLAKIHNKIAKRYNSYSDVRQHLWNHSCWLSVKCRFCCNFLANCEPIYMKHLKDRHYLLVKGKRCQFILDEDVDDGFTDEQRILIEQKFVEINSNPIIESFVHKLLNDIKDNFESQLRVQCDRHFPLVSAKRLSDKKFAKYFCEFKEYETIMSSKSNSLIDICRLIDIRCAKNDKKDPKGAKKGRKRKHSNDGEKSDRKNDTKIAEKSTTLSTIDKIHNIRAECSGRASTSTAIEDNGVESEPMAAHQMEEMAVIGSGAGAEDCAAEEEFNRVTCYHCNERFKTNKEFNKHSKKAHPYKSARCYAKPHKS